MFLEKKREFYDTIGLGVFIIHLDKKLKPLYMEIIKAKDFLLKTNKFVLEKLKNRGLTLINNKPRIYADK